MYSVKNESFEGPLDLLLSLIEKEKLDICQISLAKVTGSYLETISEIDSDANEMAEFLVIAAKLLYLKSKQLIPSAETAEEEAEIEDLEEKLREYQKYKAAAKHLENILESGTRSFAKRSKSESQIEFTPPKDVNGELLFAIFNEAINKIKEEQNEVVELKSEPKVTIDDKKIYLKHILKSKKRLSFKEALKSAKTKVEVIVTFLAVLEMIKHNEIKVNQNDNFTDFELISL
jgi:segregation and condensation protein A